MQVGRGDVGLRGRDTARAGPDDHDVDTMRAQIAAGAHGIITDYPALLRSVMTQLGMPLPPPYQPR